MNVLEEANAIIYGPRRLNYGHPLDNFTLTAALWNPILQRYVKKDGRIEIPPEGVALLMIQLKVAREMNVHTRDGAVDIAGYSGAMQEVHEERARRANDQARMGEVLPQEGLVSHTHFSLIQDPACQVETLPDQGPGGC